MAASIIATPGAADANSYITLAAAQQFADNQVNPAEWDDATDDTRTRALISATSALDTLSYIGSRSTTTQNLCWPRSNAKTAERTYSNSSIPNEIAQATFDLATALLTSPTLLTKSSNSTSLIPNIANSDLKRVKLDVMEVEWRSTSNQHVTPLTALPHLRLLLAPLLTSTPGPTIAITRS